MLGTGEVPEIVEAIGGAGIGRAARDRAVPLTLFRSSDFAAATERDRPRS